MVGEKYNHLLVLNGLRQSLWGVSGRTPGARVLQFKKRSEECAHNVCALTMKTLGPGVPYFGC